MKKVAVLAAILAVSGCAGMGAQSNDPEALIKEAEASIAKAKSAGGEWRDSGKFLKQAKEALAAGDSAKASKLATKAKMQGELGLEQAKSQKNAGPWLF